MKYRSLFAALIFLLAPASAFALQESVWDFRGNNLRKEWDYTIGNFTATRDGIRITSQDSGFIRTNNDLNHAIEMVSLTYTSKVASEAKFLWSEKGSSEKAIVEMPFILQKTSTPETVQIPVTAYQSQWDPHTPVIGFSLPAGIDMTIHAITFTRYNAIDKAVESWKTFWRADKFKGHTVNFIWGPRIAFSEAERLNVWNWSPPRSPSANSVFYVILILTAVTLVVLWKIKKIEARDAKKKFFLLLLCMWVFYDVRITSEFFSYMKFDYETYVQKEPGTKEFRGWGNFTEQLLSMETHLKDRESFVLLTPEKDARKLIVYGVYPARSVPADQADTWIVFNQLDASVNENGELVQGDTILAGPGEIIQRLGAYSFIYRTNS